MLLVSYECSRSFAARAAAFAGALSTGWAAPGLAVARRAAALAGGLTSCAVGCAAGAAATAATRSVRPAAALAALAAFLAAGTSLPAVPATSISLPAATRDVGPRTVSLAAETAVTLGGVSVATIAATRAGKLSHRFAACLATATLISRPSVHISRLHQAFLIEPDQIQATDLRERLHH